MALDGSASSSARRNFLKSGVATATLFLPAPYAWVWAQSEGAAKLLRAPKVALVIGNSNYKSSPLRNPVNDARAISEALKSTGFDVTTRLDAPQADLMQAVRAYTQALAQRQAVGLFYFAGHGLQLAWRNYMVPVDANLRAATDIQTQCVELGDLLAGIAKARNPLNLIILDACRDNPFGGLAGMDQKGLSQMDAPQSTLLAYATAPGNVASDGEGANGLYTEHLLKEIGVPEAKVEDVFKRVRLHVRRRTNGQQIPWESTSLEEDFYFVPPKTLSAVAAAEAEHERLQQEAQREKRRLAEEAERKRKEAAQRVVSSNVVEKIDPDRQFAEELSIWEKIKTSATREPLEDYLLRYPSGRFSELAQLQLDRVLARAGEKKVEAVNSNANPYTKGTVRLDTGYKVGDVFHYRELDLFTKLESRVYTQRVTAIAEQEIQFDDGNLVTDLLGNVIFNGRTKARFTGAQFYIPEYSVGKRWSARYQRFPAGQPGRNVSYEFRVLAREQVTVPAGMFNAFKIEGQGWTLTNDGRFSIQLQARYWIAPGVRQAVAFENLNRVQNTRGNYPASERMELVSYTQK